MVSNAYRRVYGLLLGAGLGLAFSLVSQTINIVLIPGVPLFEPPLGPLGNILFGVAFGALLGITNAWFETSAAGVILSSIVGGFVLLTASILAGKLVGDALGRAIFLSFLILLPISGATGILMIALRWIINRGEAIHRAGQRGEASPARVRVGLPASVLLLAAALGLFSMIPGHGRAAVARMDKLVQQGMQAQSHSQLPAPLRSPYVSSFMQKAQGPYQLQWDKDENNRFSIPRPVYDTSQQSTVIAWFEDGYILACVFAGPTVEPECKDLIE